MAEPLTKRIPLWPTRTGSRARSGAEGVDDGFLPNFCRGPIVLNVVIVALLSTPPIAFFTTSLVFGAVWPMYWPTRSSRETFTTCPRRR